MTAIMGAATTSEASAAPDETTAMLWAAIEPEFLSALRWSAESRVLVFPADDPLLGWTPCKVASCEKSARSSWGMCAACTLRWRNTDGRKLEDFLTDAKPAQRCIGVGPCAVKECQRPWKTSKLLLCIAHDVQRRRTLRLSMESFLTHPDVVPLPALGPCRVAACTRARPGSGPYCHAHQQRWQAQSKRTPGLDVEVWRRTASAVAENNEVSMRGLPPRVVAEVIYGLQQRYRSGSKTRYWDLRPLCTLLRQAQVGSLTELPTDRLTRQMRVLRTTLSNATRRLGLTPETERVKDVWDLTVFGHRGTLSFTGISQAWLREAAKRWAFDDLPKRRGNNANVVAQNRVSALTQLSDSLRLQRDDNGTVIAKLGRQDISAFCNRLAYLTGNGAISAYQRLAYCRFARWMLNRMRSMGLTKSGEPLHGLPMTSRWARTISPMNPRTQRPARTCPRT